MLVYEYDTDEHGLVTFPDLDSVMEAIRNDLAGYSEFPDMIEDGGDEINLKVTLKLMSQEQFDALPEVD